MLPERTDRQFTNPFPSLNRTAMQEDENVSAETLEQLRRLAAAALRWAGSVVAWIPAEHRRLLALLLEVLAALIAPRAQGMHAAS